MKKPIYSKLDAALLAVIAQLAPVRLHELNKAGRVKRQAEALETATKGRSAGTGDEVPAWRFVDRRLQALRRAGRIRFKSETGAHGWIIVEGAR